MERPMKYKLISYITLEMSGTICKERGAKRSNLYPIPKHKVARNCKHPQPHTCYFIYNIKSWTVKLRHLCLKLSLKMACINHCSITNVCGSKLFFTKENSRTKLSFRLFRVRASSDNPEDCNDEECAPDKEVGKISMEWVAEERTKVVGTYPPRKKSWSGYVEKDTAGQTNIYSVEPAVYVAESAISSGTAGSSSDGAENTAGIAAFIGLISVAAASSILLQVGKNPPPQVQTTEYSGPSLSYYIDKFKPPEIIQALVPAETETSVPAETETLIPAETETSVSAETATSASTLQESSVLDATVTETLVSSSQESPVPDAPQMQVPAETQLDAPIESIS